MNKTNIFMFLIILLISVYILYYLIQKPTTEQPTIEQPTIEQPTIEQPTTQQPTINLEKKDAICKRELSLDYYTFDKTKTYLGKDILSIEHFVLSPTIVTELTSIDPNKFYYKGIRNTSATIIPAANGGITCIEFPNVVYKSI